MKKIISCICIASALFGASGHAAIAPPVTEVKYLSGTDKDHRVNWEFFLDAGRNGGAWKTIPVPSNWELEGFGTYRYGHDTGNDAVPDNLGKYRYQFALPAGWKGQQVEIVFGGAMTDTEVKINGQLAGPVHQGGFYEFRYDITPLLKAGENNLLEVNVKRISDNASVNRAERSSDFWLFSGIYRPVWLEAKPASHIDHLTVDARHTGQFDAEVFPGKQVKPGDSVRAQLTTMDGKKIGQPLSAPVDSAGGVARLHGSFAQVTPWTAENPQRYKMVVELVSDKQIVHQVSKTIGFRTVELRKQDGLYVNGEKVRLKGSNRHSIWPTSGRTTSKELSYTDARLMKDMNMNAVRMSHYPPDEHFLDVADEVGLYVIDELTGWQKAYDTEIAAPLVKEMVRRDQHHPSIILWANGNEGGFPRGVDTHYDRYDLQKRPVIHPWENFGGLDTAHYPAYDCCATSLFHGRDVFMPTEFLHGLYDGGAGAGLNDWWNAMLGNPLSAGGFIWAFADEGVVRTDKNGEVDAWGNRGPDGIVGPYREKEGSFYAIKRIWSPVYLPLAEMAYLPASFDGRIVLENRYDFSNLKSVKLSWKLVKFASLGSGKNAYQVGAEGKLASPDAGPGMRGATRIGLPADWSKQDALLLSAVDGTGREIYTWSWMIASARTVATQTLAQWQATHPLAGAASVAEQADAYELKGGNVSVSIDKRTGYLRQLRKGDTLVPLTNGPRLVTGSATLKSISAVQEGADVLVSAAYTGNLQAVQWRLNPAGRLTLSYSYQMESRTAPFDFLGVSFDYPEAQVKSMRWLGKGPYRVWKNRLQGVEFNVWQKDYNDTVSGVSWQYPEFKGYHDKVYWAELQTKNLPLTFVNHSDDIALRVFTPKEAPPGDLTEPKATHVDFPTGDISLLHAIGPIGDKFRPSGELGPSGQKARIPNLGAWLTNTVDIVIGDPR